ncbi:MAG: hypothetical protein KIT43_00100 [Bauldia sp.]|nr:hypothetical protein [Bauldia sp.]
MGRQFGGAVAILVAAACLAGGVAAQEAAGRFELAPDGDGFLRLDTQTGAVSYCRIVDGRWTCEAADTGGLAAAVAAINERLGAIDTELAAIRAALAAPQAADPALTDAVVALAAQIDAALAAAPTPGLPDILAELDGLARRLDALVAAPAPDPAVADLQPVLDAIAALAGRIDGQGAAAAPPSGAALVEPLRDEIARLAARIEALAATPVAPAVLADAALEPLRAEIAALSDRVAELVAAQAARAGTPVPAVPVPDRETVAALVEIGQRLAGLDGAVAALRAAPPDLALVAAIAALGTELDAVAQAVAAIVPAPVPDPAGAARLVAIENRLASLTVAVSALRQEAAAPETTLAALRDDVTALVGQVGALDGLPAAVEAVAGRIDAVATQQAALAAAESPGIAPPDLVAVTASLREELAVLAAEIDRIGVIAVTAAPEITARLDAIEAAVTAIAPAAEATTAPLLQAVAELGADIAALRQMTDGTDISAALTALDARLATLEAGVAALVPVPYAPGVAADAELRGTELRGTGVRPEPATFAEELRRRLFDLGAALRRGLGG